MAFDEKTNPLDDRRKANEEAYFQKQNREASEKMKAKQALADEGITSDELLQELTKSGFDADSARILYLLPMLEVAWSDGRVQEEERLAILSLAEEREISHDSKAYALLEAWTKTDPREKPQFQKASALLAPLVENLKTSGKAEGAEWMIEAAKQVAEATGGFFGFGDKISGEEEMALRAISKKLKGPSNP